MTGRAGVITGDAARLPLPDASVDLIVTSPPYWSLRSYEHGGQPVPGQLGAEPDWRDYLENLWACTAEWLRVLKPGGSLAVNIGDKYSDLGSLLNLPHRYAIGCTDRLGLIQRAEIIWAKVNHMPESVTNRVARAHEHLFHFTRPGPYYSAVDEIREPHTMRHQRRPNGHKERQRLGVLPAQTYSTSQRDEPGVDGHPLGRLPGSVWRNPGLRDILVAVAAGRLDPQDAERMIGVGQDIWTIPTAPLTCPSYYWRPPWGGLAWLKTDAEAWAWLRDTGRDRSLLPRAEDRGELRAAPTHYAAMPPALVRPVILGWSPPGICTQCGEGRRPVMAEVGWARGKSDPVRDTPSRFRSPLGRQNGNKEGKLRSAVGYACACPQPDAPTRPAVVLDPCGGTGTVALTAAVHGRHGITSDLSGDYSLLATWRTRDPGERARALAVPKPPPVPAAQAALFD